MSSDFFAVGERKLLAVDRQTDATVLYPVIFPEGEGGQINLNVVTVLCSSKNSTDTKRGFAGEEIFYLEHALAYPNHCFMTCGGPKSLTSTIIFKICGVKTSPGGQERYIL